MFCGVCCASVLTHCYRLALEQFASFLNIFVLSCHAAATKSNRLCERMSEEEKKSKSKAGTQFPFADTLVRHIVCMNGECQYHLHRE